LREPFIKICHDWINESFININNRKHIHVDVDGQKQIHNYGIEHISQKKFFAYRMEINKSDKYVISTFFRFAEKGTLNDAINRINNFSKTKFDGIRQSEYKIITNSCLHESWKGSFADRNLYPQNFIK